MPRDFFPRREADVNDWSRVFSQTLSADPEAFGVSAGQAAAYQAKHDAFAAAYLAAQANDTRTPTAIIRKNRLLAELEAEARMLGRLIRGTPTVTAVQRAELGLSLPTEGRGAPIGVPDAAPNITIVAVTGTTVTFRLWDAESPTRRGKPRGVAGASVFTFVGDEPPISTAGWTAVGGTTRTTMSVPFPGHLAPGTKVWITACWQNPRAQRGIASPPRYAHLQYGIMLPGSLSRAA